MNNINNSELREKLLAFQRMIEEIRRLKEEVANFEAEEDIPPGLYKVGSYTFKVALRNGAMTIQIAEQPVDLG